MPYANNKGADQPAHPRSLINAFVVRCLHSIIPLLAKSEISRLKLASEEEQAGLSLTWSQSPEDRVSRDVAHLLQVNASCLVGCARATLRNAMAFSSQEDVRDQITGDVVLQVHTGRLMP